MKLTVLERIRLVNILPAEGDFRTMKTISQLRDRLLFNEDEVKRLKLVTEDQQVKWNPDADGEGSEIEVGELATEIIVGQLKKMDDEKKVTVDYLPLWERFIEDK